MKYTIRVGLKPEVLDPEGRAISQTLKKLGYDKVSDVKVEKTFHLEVEGKDGEAIAKEIAEKVLSNPVAQTYSISSVPDSSKSES